MKIREVNVCSIFLCSSKKNLLYEKNFANIYKIYIYKLFFPTSVKYIKFF